MAIDFAVGVPNEVANKAAIAGFETTRGVATTPDFRLRGQLELTTSQTLQRTDTATGGFDRFRSLSKGIKTRSGTYGESLTFDSAAVMAAIAVGDPDVVAHAGATGAYDWHAETNFDTDDHRSLTVAHGIDGIAMEARGVSLSEFTLAIDIDDADNAWKISGPLFSTYNEPLEPYVVGVATGGTATTLVMTGAGWTVNAHAGLFVTLKFPTGVGAVREILSNTADTLTWTTAVAAGDIPAASQGFLIAASMPVEPILEDESVIPVEGSRFFLDLATGTIGTTELTDRVISASLTHTVNRGEKRFWSGTSNKTGRSGRVITIAIAFEHDRWDEWQRWNTNALLAVRMRSTGEQLDDSPLTLETITVDLPAVRLDEFTPGSRDNNMIATLTGVLELPDSDPTMSWDIINGMSILP